MQRDVATARWMQHFFCSTVGIMAARAATLWKTAQWNQWEANMSHEKSETSEKSK
jgi:hypothetical protein